MCSIDDLDHDPSDLSGGHTIPYHTIPYHTIPYHTIPYHTVPYYTIVLVIRSLTRVTKSHLLALGTTQIRTHDGPIKHVFPSMISMISMFLRINRRINRPCWIFLVWDRGLSALSSMTASKILVFHCCTVPGESQPDAGVTTKRTLYYSTGPFTSR